MKTPNFVFLGQKCPKEVLKISQNYALCASLGEAQYTDVWLSIHISTLLIAEQKLSVAFLLRSSVKLARLLHTSHMALPSQYLLMFILSLTIKY